MKLSAVEKMLVNNPVRAFLQRQIEIPLLLDGFESMRGKTVLEIGCGQGVLTQMLLQKFGPKHVIAFDIDPEQVSRANSRLLAPNSEKLSLLVANAELIPLADSSVDAVVEVATLHHVLKWPKCVQEIARVLKVGGGFFFEEPSSRLTDNLLVRFVLRHREEHGFTRNEFRRALERAGYDNLKSIEPLGIFIFGHATRVS